MHSDAVMAVSDIVDDSSCSDVGIYRNNLTSLKMLTSKDDSNESSIIISPLKDNNNNTVQIVQPVIDMLAKEIVDHENVLVVNDDLNDVCKGAARNVPLTDNDADDESSENDCSFADPDYEAETDMSTDDSYDEIQDSEDSNKAKGDVPDVNDDADQISGDTSNKGNMVCDADQTEEDIDYEEDLQSSYRRQMQNVTLPIYNEVKHGKRNYRKNDYCLFCDKVFPSKISAHYFSSHCEEQAVIEVRMLSVGSLKRKIALLKLQNQGNFKHNCKVIEAGEGELVVRRRPAGNKQYRADQFVPCEFCYGFFLQESLWLHIKNCLLKPIEKQPESNFLRNALTMIAPFTKKSDDDSSHVDDLICGMRETNLNPGIALICKNDPLIREFASSLLERLGTKQEQRRKDVINIRQKVRTVGRFLKKANDLNDGSWKEMSHFITGLKFKLVVKTVKTLAQESDSPQLALVLGHYLKQACLLKISVGIQQGSVEVQAEGRAFKELYEAHWTNSVSAVACRRQRLRLINKAPLIPLTTDLVKLRDWILSEIAKIMEKETLDCQTWTRLAELVMVRVVMFNKRRISEVEEIKVSDFLERQSGIENDDILNSLEVTEKALASRMSVLEVRGKSTRAIRRVFVLLSPDMIGQIEFMLKKMAKPSRYLFSRPRQLSSPLDGCTAVRNVTSACPGLQEPSRIRTTYLRKYMATTAQLLDMNHAELQMVADHMGHNVNIHTDIYRLQSSVLERTKVARVLIAMENGAITHFQGKKLSDITIDDLPVPIAYEDGWNASPELGTSDRSAQPQPGTSQLPADELVMEQNGATDMLVEPVGAPDKVVEPHVAPDIVVGSDDDEDMVHMEREKKRSGGQDRKPPTPRKKTRWTEDENKVFFKKMDPFFRSQQNPPGQVVKELVSALSGRTEPQIRTKISNILRGKQKYKSGV